MSWKKKPKNKKFSILCSSTPTCCRFQLFACNFFCNTLSFNCMTIDIIAQLVLNVYLCYAPLRAYGLFTSKENWIMPIPVKDFINVYIFSVAASPYTNIQSHVSRAMLPSFCEKHNFFFFQFAMKYGKYCLLTSNV